MLLLCIWQQIKEARCPRSDGGLPHHKAFEYFLSEETNPALLEANKDSNALPLHKDIGAVSSEDGLMHSPLPAPILDLKRPRIVQSILLQLQLWPDRLQRCHLHKTVSTSSAKLQPRLWLATPLFGFHQQSGIIPVLNNGNQKWTRSGNYYS